MWSESNGDFSVTVCLSVLCGVGLSNDEAADGKINYESIFGFIFLVFGIFMLMKGVF